jgi:hypothetical protein
MGDRRSFRAESRAPRHYSKRIIDLLWIESSFQQVLQEAESLGGIWEVGRTLAGHSLRARTGAAEP